MFEATHSERSSAPPEAIWALWIDAGRWPDWNEQLESAELDGPPEVGTGATVKFRRGGKMRLALTELEPGRLLAHEARLPGCRSGHRHLVEPAGTGSQITHTVYVRGFTSGLFSRLFSRRKLRRSVERFTELERELAE